MAAPQRVGSLTMAYPREWAILQKELRGGQTPVKERALERMGASVRKFPELAAEPMNSVSAETSEHAGGPRVRACQSALLSCWCGWSGLHRAQRGAEARTIGDAIDAYSQVQRRCANTTPHTVHARGRTAEHARTRAREHAHTPTSTRLRTSAHTEPARAIHTQSAEPPAAAPVRSNCAAHEARVGLCCNAPECVQCTATSRVAVCCPALQRCSYPAKTSCCLDVAAHTCSPSA
jgi:hypothetical protein